MHTSECGKMHIGCGEIHKESVKYTQLNVAKYT